MFERPGNIRFFSVEELSGILVAVKERAFLNEFIGGQVNVDERSFILIDVRGKQRGKLYDITSPQTEDRLFIKGPSRCPPDTQRLGVPSRKGG